MSQISYHPESDVSPESPTDSQLCLSPLPQTHTLLKYSTRVTCVHAMGAFHTLLITKWQISGISLLFFLFFNPQGQSAISLPQTMESNPCDAMVPLPPVGRAARAWRECPYDVMVILLVSAHIGVRENVNFREIEIQIVFVYSRKIGLIM